MEILINHFLTNNLETHGASKQYTPETYLRKFYIHSCEEPPSIGEIATKDEFIKDNQIPLRQWPTVDFQ